MFDSLKDTQSTVLFISSETVHIKLRHCHSIEDHHIQFFKYSFNLSFSAICIFFNRLHVNLYCLFGLSVSK